VVSFGSATGVPPVNGHGQDGRATPNDTTTSGGASVMCIVTPHGVLVIPAKAGVRRQHISEGLRSGFPLARE